MSQIQEVQSLLERLEAILGPHGIEVSLFLDLGNPLSIADLTNLFADPDQYHADTQGVTKDQYIAFAKHDFRCRANNKNRKRCRNPVATEADLHWCPKDFDPSKPEFLYCWRHIKK